MVIRNRLCSLLYSIHNRLCHEFSVCSQWFLYVAAHMVIPYTSKIHTTLRAQITLHSLYLTFTHSPSPFSSLLKGLSFWSTFSAPSPSPINKYKRGGTQHPSAPTVPSPNPNTGLLLQ